MDEAAAVIGYIVGVIISSVICGIISRAISKSRGMEGGFWWGFFLYIIGIIVVAVKPNDNKLVASQVPTISPYEDLEKLAKLKEQGVLTDDEYTKLKAECLSRIK